MCMSKVFYLNAKNKLKMHKVQKCSLFAFAFALTATHMPIGLGTLLLGHHFHNFVGIDHIFLILLILQLKQLDLVNVTLLYIRKDPILILLSLSPLELQ